MSSTPTLWERLRHARVVQVVVVYLGASWLIMQVSTTVVDAFHLPEWVMPTEIILMLVGLIVVVATAWVQSLASTTAGEQAGNLPKDWELAPRDAIASLRRGRLPHLTWGRALLGGVVMLSLLFGGAGTYVGFMNGRIGPGRANASEALEGIAVVPFEVRGGADLDIWREGMMDMLTSGLDGVGGFRTIDTRTVMARWRDHIGDGAADLNATLDVARATGARYALEGSVVALGSDVRLAAKVYDVDTGRDVASANTEGPVTDVMRLVDELAVGTMRSLLLALGRKGAGDESAETITTTSLPALRAYLEGEKHYRRGDFAGAVQRYEQAVAADSTFAIALVRLAEAYGWLESANSDRMLEVGERAFAQAPRLSPRYQFIMTGWRALNHLNADGVESLRDATRKYPDDPNAWFLLAETYLHVGGATYGTDADLWEALQMATKLDDEFAPYLTHIAEVAIVNGDRATAERTLARYDTLTGGLEDTGHIQLAIKLLTGTRDEVASVLGSLDTLSERTLDLYLGTFARRHDRWGIEAPVEAAMGRVTGQNRQPFQAYYAAGMGEVARGNTLVKDPAIPPAHRTVYYGYLQDIWNIPPPPGAMNLDVCDGPMHLQCAMYVGLSAIRAERWSENERAIAWLLDMDHTRTDSLDASRHRMVTEALRGAALRKRGDVDAARAVLEPVARSATVGGERARIELAWLHAEAGRPQEALRHFHSVINGFLRPQALYGIATMHEQLGQQDEARKYWQKFTTLTETGDPLPRIVEARNALARLVPAR